MGIRMSRSIRTSYLASEKPTTAACADAAVAVPEPRGAKIAKTPTPTTTKAPNTFTNILASPYACSVHSKTLTGLLRSARNDRKNDMRRPFLVVVHRVLCDHALISDHVGIACVGIRIVDRVIAARYVKPNAVALRKQIAGGKHWDRYFIYRTRLHHFRLGISIPVVRSQDAIGEIH